MATTTTKNALQNAERTAFDQLKTATADKENETAFLGMLPAGVFNAWGFWAGGGNADLTWGQNFNNYIAECTFVGRYQKRDDAHAIAGSITNMLRTTSNVNKLGNVQWFRYAAGGMPTITDELWVVNDAELIAWQLNMTFELVYHSVDF